VVTVVNSSKLPGSGTSTITVQASDDVIASRRT
jgi:hypothetical protein